MDHSSGCSTLEDLAAFAEGRLRGAERAQVIDHLAGCADCREVLAESMETAEELEAEEVPSPVAEHVWGKWRPSAAAARLGPLAPALEEQLRTAAARRPPYSRWLARAASLAAAALVAVGAVVMWQANAARTPPDRSEWLAAMPPAQELTPHVWGGLRFRGGERADSEEARRAVELGALLVAADVALSAGDAANAHDYLYRMATICEDAGFLEDEVKALRETGAETGDAAAMKAKLAAHRPELEQNLRERFEPFFLDLGTFLNEANIAARTGRANFLDTPQAQRYLAWVLSQGHERLPDALLSRWELYRDEVSVTYSEQQQFISEILDPVRDELLVLRKPDSSAAARAEAAEQILDALTG